jgi:DNA invertase Pin-like site-specific DNA recombinase
VADRQAADERDGVRDELEREKARQRTYDALARKARAGHVTGGVVFGYRNREVVAGNGRRQYVEREIDPGEAAIVWRIFEMCAAGVGVRRIGIRLNDEGAPAPTPRRSGWPRRGPLRACAMSCIAISTAES